MQTYSIPIIDRERYLNVSKERHEVKDSCGKSKLLWPITREIPTEMYIHLENGCLKWIELSYHSNHGELIQHTNRHGSFDIFLYHGHLSTIRPFPSPCCSEAYDTVKTYIERLVETFRFQTNLAPGKWKTIFTGQILMEQWSEGETHLRRLLETQSHPFR